MKPADLERIPVYQTKALAEDIQRDPAIDRYITECLERMYAGDYGLLRVDDIRANEAELGAGMGKVIARYPALAGTDMEQDIYIICHFSDKQKGMLDYENCVAMYCNEY